MTDIPMKPCPLACGGPAEWISVHPQGYIRCTKCKLATIIDDQFELTEAWNTRPPTANPLPDEVGALIDALVSEIRGPEMPEGYYRQRIVAFAERLSTDRDSVIEECAKVAELYRRDVGDGDDSPLIEANATCDRIAAAIRARRTV